ncbi:MAG: long-chain fatty acid--CoA ligase [Acidimicrobiia bacterium]|nr:AMP-binding protein [Microthrixaceae bacterium]RTL09178.1 MAG: long-chain fatty acid--CoA ligase [Acidimicrobiia bacterium]MCB9376338.1 AMP-binding protein [Microthrixaceae bacterium]MCB9401096.1 AMP-binding protein [Microthrixaceae bacterium]MCO5306750.1 AMP-binding protein [Microthrixaceae bacterium]
MNLATIIDPHPGEATALISRGRETDYDTLRTQVAALRGALVEMGLEPGERLAIIAGNNWYFVVSYLAALGAGLVAVPLNPTNPAVAMAHELSESGAVAIVATPTARAALREIDWSTLPDVRTFIGAGFEPGPLGVDIDTLLDHEPAPVVERAPDDVAVLIFTSGTAGSPRPAMLTHANLLANIRQVLAADERVQEPTDVVFGLLPMFHIFGLNVMLGVAMAVGASVLLVERFDPVSAIESVEKHGVTTIAGPPTMWAAFAGLPGVGGHEFDSVRRAISGAAKLPTEVAQAMEARYGVHLQEGYGLTEASPVVTAPISGVTPSGSVGIPVPGVEMRLVDGDGDDVLVGDPGELLVRGPNVFAGYWNDQEATDRVITADGWLRTGDVGVVDDDGNVYLVDRAKDLIIVSGFNVFPSEVEEVLLQHPAVEGVAVVGVPHPHTGESVKAYVKARDGVPIEEDDVIDFCAARLPHYKCPNKVWFVEDIPRGLGGKVIRRLLG